MRARWRRFRQWLHSEAFDAFVDELLRPLQPITFKGVADRCDPDEPADRDRE